MDEITRTKRPISFLKSVKNLFLVSKSVPKALIVFEVRIFTELYKYAESFLQLVKETSHF
jgi:hypothetical protein